MNNEFDYCNPNQKMMIGFMVSSSNHALFTEHCKNHGICKSEALRQFVEWFISKNHPNIQKIQFDKASNG